MADLHASELLDSEPLPVITSNVHHTCIPHGQVVQLTKCNDTNCNCEKVHCPFCDTDHFRPAKPARVRDHLELKHFAHAVQFKDLLIVKCFTKCDNRPACHYHCPVCHTKILKRRAFVRHLLGHAVTMGLGPEAVKAPHDKTPQKIIAHCDDNNTFELELCTDNCQDKEGGHFHCPFCDRTSPDRSMIITHIWRCKDLKSLDPKKNRGHKEDNPYFSVEGIVHPRDNPEMKWHKSIVRNLGDLPLIACEKKDCCEGRFHCQLCERDKFQPAFRIHASVHQMSHWKKRTKFREYSILPCFLQCQMDQGLNMQLRSHYHCPICGECRRRRTSFLHHIKICQGTRYDTLRFAMAKSQKLKELDETGEQNEEEGSLAVVASPLLNSIDVREKEEDIRPPEPIVTQDSDLPHEETFQMDLQPPTPVDPLTDSTELGNEITEAADTKHVLVEEKIDLSKVMIFEQMTARISEELLKAIGSERMASLLEEVSGSLDVSFSSSPTVTSTIYTVTGQLEELVIAKQSIRKILCPNQQNVTDESSDNIVSENLDEDGTMNGQSCNITVLDETEAEGDGQTESQKEHQKQKCKRKAAPGVSDSRMGYDSSPKAKKARKETSHSTELADNCETVKAKQKKVKASSARKTDTVQVKRYSTRGVKMDFSLLHSGRESSKNIVKLEAKEQSSDTEKDTEGKAEKTSQRRSKRMAAKGSEAVKATSTDSPEEESEKNGSPEIKKRTEEADHGRQGKGDNPVRNNSKGIGKYRKVEKEEDDIAEDDDVDEKEDLIDRDSDPDFELPPERKYKVKKGCTEEVNSDMNNIAYIPPVVFVGIKVQKRKFRDGSKLEPEGKVKLHGKKEQDISDSAKDSEIVSRNGTKAGIIKTEESLNDSGRQELNIIGQKSANDNEEEADKSPENDVLGEDDVSPNGEIVNVLRKRGDRKRNFICRHCGRNCDDFISLTEHLLLNHQDMETWRCDVCKREFSKEHHLDRHLYLKHGPKTECLEDTGTFLCKICVKSFHTEIALAKHMVSKHGKEEMKGDLENVKEEYVMCEICGKRFVSSSHLLVHKQAIHQKQKVECEICGKSFNHARYLQSHLKRHKGEKTKECPTCGIKFIDNNTLRAHLETHKKPEDRVYNYVCSYCGMKHNNKSFFLDHLNKHTGERPHVCDICGRTFAFRSALSKHRFYIHSTEKPFKCKYCDKAFKLKRLLDNHIVTHTGESSFVCDKCNKTFSCSYTLNKHSQKCKSVIVTSDLAQRLGMTFVVTTNPNALLETGSENLVNSEQMKQQQIITLPSLQESIETSGVAMEAMTMTNQDSLTTQDGSMKEISAPDTTGEQEPELYVCSECSASFSNLAEAEEHVLTSHMDITDIEEEVDQGIELEDLESVRVILTADDVTCIETDEQGQ